MITTLVCQNLAGCYSINDLVHVVIMANAGEGELPYSQKYLRELPHFNLAVAKVDRQTAKFNSPPNFLAIQCS